MARVCELTGKSVLTGNTVSNANNKRRTRFFPNLSTKRLFVPELNSFVSVQISKRAMRAIDKLGGVVPACRRYKKTLSPRLARLLKRAA